GHGLAAARAALGRGDRSQAEQLFRTSIAIAEQTAGAESALAGALNELAALRRDMGEPREAEGLYRRALALLEALPTPDDATLFVALEGLGATTAGRGDTEAAEACLARALDVGERMLGADHPDLAPLLGDLSRLFLARAAHASAEPLLLRLHDLKRRSKGDDHPETATVLASLAMVRQALGRHDEAESMWRSVLAVRERTLAPNHFATAMAMEHLADACAARGKLTEALELLRRATTMREVTLGTTHPSVRVARDRIADLQLQASDAFSEFTEPSRPVLPAPRRQESRNEYSLFIPAAAAVSADAPARPPQAFVLPSDGALALQESSAPRAPTGLALSAQAGLASIQAELEASGMHDDEGEGDTQRHAVGATMAALLAHGRAPIVISGSVVAILLLGAFAVRSRASVRADAAAMSPATVPVSPRVVQTSDGRADTTTFATAARATAETPATPSATPAPAPAARHEASAEAAPATRKEAPLVAPSIRKVVLGNIDALTRSLKTPPVESAAFPVHLAADDPKRQILGSVDGPVELVRAQLIGAAPQPRFPEILRDRKIDGDVVVRFTVDAQGRPVPSTIVVLRTPHELLSDVVRRAVPSMRFEPAHRATIGAPAQPDEIQMSFQFSSGVK
ncbi:MAG TPA: TonB family protein, partial [Gemmatimonadaceae bacterium]|nr:TonB family protein [Gemmatimonadaceae bacterium]